MKENIITSICPFGGAVGRYRPTDTIQNLPFCRAFAAAAAP